MTQRLPTPVSLSATLMASALACAPLAPRAAEAETATFAISIAGIPAGRMTLVRESGDGAYRAATRIEATGLIGVFTDYGFDGQARGRLTGDGIPVPEVFRAQSQSPRADRITEIDWTDGTPSRVSVVPPRDSAPDPATQGGTLDPVSAGFLVLAETTPAAMCNERIDIFDGSRRSRLTLGAPEPTDQGYVCAGSLARVEGEAHTATDQRSFPFRVLFREGDAGRVRVERIETSTRYGTAVIERRG